MATHTQGLPVASVRDRVAVILDVLLPFLARGAIIRRPAMVRLAERFDLDRRAVRRMQRLRARYGPGPLLVPLPLGTRALILSPDDVHRVLARAPQDFAVATRLKRAALAHFEPAGSLITPEHDRPPRRRFSEEVLQAGRPIHGLADAFHRLVAAEVGEMLATARARGRLDWEVFLPAWYRIVRRILFGDGARNDEQLTDMLRTLRLDANWLFLRPVRSRLLRRYRARLASHFARGEPGSLASLVASRSDAAAAQPLDQGTQWLFAFDAAGIATFRTLGLLATHAPERDRARSDAAARDRPAELPYIRACVLDALRLWPTVPMLLRETTRETGWDAGVMPGGTEVAVFAPFFHRDDRRLPEADRFSPDLWLDHRSDSDWPLLPFSEGPAVCPGRELVLLVSSLTLSAILAGHEIDLRDPARLDADTRLPSVLDHYSLRFDVRPKLP